jgi:hypothetical protein
MTKFQMVAMIAILALGTMAGCLEGDDSCPPNICDVCGNRFCGAEEYAAGTCPEDCGSGWCGDGICDMTGYENCSTCPEDCHTGCSDAGSDTDADPDATDDGTTDETARCPNIAGDWDLTYRNGETGSESHETLTLTQDGCLVIGMDDICEWSGTISEGGSISVFVDCYGESGDRTVTGSFTQPPPRMGGDYWVSATPPWSGTWWADPQ